VSAHTSTDDRVNQAARFVVAVDEQLARDAAIRERHDARVRLELRVGHESRHQSLVHGAEVAHRIPYDRRILVDDDLTADRLCLRRRASEQREAAQSGERTMDAIHVAAPPMRRA
jgi:hypothetical protein